MESKFKIILNLLFKKVEYVQKVEPIPTIKIVEKFLTPLHFRADLNIPRYMYDRRDENYFINDIRERLLMNPDIVHSIKVTKNVGSESVKLIAEIKILLN